MIKLDMLYTKRNLTQALNHRLVLKKGLTVIKFNQNDWLKPYIGMNAGLRKKSKKWFWKSFFKLMNNAVFGKTMKNVRKHRDIKLVTTERRRNNLVSKPNYHTTKFFTENLSTIKMKKTEILMNKSVHLGLSIKYEFCYDYVKPK